MRILLLGCNGQVGWELQRSLSLLGDLTALDHDSSGPWRADFGQPDALPAMLQALRPDVIVNAAAYTAVDKAESEPELARTLNATAPDVLARHAATTGATLVHYSTDYVFDGRGDTPRREDDAAGPLSVYGRTKLEGEELIRASGCRHLILRTSWVYAARGSNFARTILRLAAERDELQVVDDQIGAPTGADLLADVTAHALRTLQHHPAFGGTYHCVAAGQTSWHAYARFVVEWARERGHPVKVAPEAIQPVPTTAFPTPAQRPLNSRLDATKLQHVFGLRLPPWQVGVARMLAEILTR
jgi:dTDP-4-dehydrorhamnose reductase